MKAFVIVLQSSPLAQSISNEAMSAAAEHGVTLEVYDAVLGYNSAPLFDRYNIDKFLNYTIIDKPGHQGCFLSHFELWLKCVELNQPVIILEHDGIFTRPLPEDVLDHFNEVLRLDCYQWFKEGYNDQVKSSLDQPVDYCRRPTDYEYHSSGGYYVGAYGYIVKPQGAKKLIDHAQQNGAVCTEAHIGLKIVDIVSTTVTVVRMHEHYVEQDQSQWQKYSTTNDLGLAVKGSNSLVNPKYISPKKYQERYSKYTKESVL
jgi:glycosyl transferase family 25